MSNTLKLAQSIGRGRAMLSSSDASILAAAYIDLHERMGKIAEAFLIADWEQVRLNGGPPCFHLENGRFCLRAQRWEGHKKTLIHEFVSAPSILALTKGKPE